MIDNVKKSLINRISSTSKTNFELNNLKKLNSKIKKTYFKKSKLTLRNQKIKKTITPFTKKTKIRVNFQKPLDKPMISPIESHSWECLQTFNAATIEIDGTIYFLYRAVGEQWISRIGLATSKDGLHIDERLSYPIYSYFTPSQMTTSRRKNHLTYPDYSSGGGVYGGCEDPRATVIGDTIYMVFVAYDGCTEPRLAMTTISVKNFLNRIWLWSPVKFISRPYVVNKSGVIFPEKIDDEFIIFHRVFPNILIDKRKSLDFDGNNFLTEDTGITIRNDIWDSRKIGAGAPPIKTRYGWLLIYYATDDRDASQYKIGIMILDLKDPTKVLYRTNAPAIEPDEWYDNVGNKPGIVYPCGAILRENDLFVYYGGADNYLCVATTKLDKLIYQLQNQNVTI